MLYTMYYAILAKNILVEKIQSIDPEIAKYWKEPLLWSRLEGGPRKIFSYERTAIVKITFLLHTKKMFSDTPLTEIVFHEKQIEPSLFDQWWEIIQFDQMLEEFEDICQVLTKEDVDAVPKTNNPIIDDWLEHFGTDE